MTHPMGPGLTAIDVADPPEAWERAGFRVSDGIARIGHVDVRLGADGRGIVAWELTGVDAVEVDGLRTVRGNGRDAPAGGGHPNSSTLIDHLVLFSPDGLRTATIFDGLGMPQRRERSTEKMHQRFFRAGEVIIELVSGTSPASDATGPASFFGIACTVDSLDECVELFGDALGAVKDAVQPGRQIATLRHRELGVSVPIAFMTDEAPR